jgi:hypothetical protein
LDESQKTLQRLERLRQLNTDRNWVNDNLYRLMYKEDLYILAYERIKLYVCTFEKGGSRKGHHVVSRRRITTLETMEVSDASSHYMSG